MIKKCVFWALTVAVLMPVAAVAQATAAPPRPAPAVPANAPANAPHAADIRAARQVGEDWMHLMDDDKYDQAYTEMSQAARNQVSKEDWKGLMKDSRSTLGKISAREYQNSDYSTKVSGAPVGEYVVFQYLCTYAQDATALETLVLAKETGQWRVAGFSLK